MEKKRKKIYFSLIFGIIFKLTKLYLLSNFVFLLDWFKFIFCLFYFFIKNFYQFLQKKKTRLK